MATDFPALLSCVNCFESAKVALEEEPGCWSVLLNVSFGTPLHQQRDRCLSVSKGTKRMLNLCLDKCDLQTFAIPLGT